MRSLCWIPVSRSVQQIWTVRSRRRSSFTFLDDPMFWSQAQGYVAINNLWFSMSNLARCDGALPGGFIGPDGHCLSRYDTNTTAEFLQIDLDKNSPACRSLLSRQGSGIAKQEGGEAMSMAWPMIKEAKTYGSFNGKTMLMDLHLFHRRTATNVFVCRSKRRTLSVLVRSAVIIIRPQKKMKTQTGAGLVSIAGWLRLWARRSEWLILNVPWKHKGNYNRKSKAYNGTRLQPCLNKK